MEDNKKPLSEFEKMVSNDGFVSIDDNESSNESNIELPKTNEEVLKEVELPKSNQEVLEEIQSPLENLGVQAKEDLENSMPKPIDNPTYIQEVPKEVELPKTNEENSVQAINDSQVNTLNNGDVTIGTVKADTQKSPIAMIILFGLLALFIIFMQPILELTNSLFGTNIETYSGVDMSDDTTTTTDDETSEIVMYSLSEDSVVTIDNIEITGFKMSNTDGYKLSFSIKNKGTLIYSFSNKVYLEYYDDNNTFIGRSYLENVNDITAGVTNTYTVAISSEVYSNATKFELIQRTDDSYPQVTLTNNQLTCSNDSDTIVYTFTDNKLITIRDMYSYTRGNDLEEYNEELLSNKTKIENLDRLDGITAVLTETDTGFITSILIDYSNADYKQISSNKNYYIKDTYARIISFEMNAKGYTCG